MIYSAVLRGVGALGQESQTQIDSGAAFASEKGLESRIEKSEKKNILNFQ